MSQGILQLAVSGTVPLQLEYVPRPAAPFPPESTETESYNQVNESLEEEFSCLLELI